MACWASPRRSRASSERRASPSTGPPRHDRKESLTMIDYKEYKHLVFERRPNGVLLITINRPDRLNATNDRLHWELTQIWLTLDRDADARIAVVTGAGRAFSAGGDMDM